MKKFVVAAALGATVLTGVAHAGQQGTAAPRRVGLMAMIDTNKDGVVAREEALAAADLQFARMDQNKDGKIDTSEMRPPHRRGGDGVGKSADGKAAPGMHRGGGMGQRMLARVDANKDGAISREEFRTAATTRFERMDANRDGRIDAAEQNTMRDRMKARSGRNAPPAGVDD
jgi:Ca2+-binding EF-hand superfamily protein